MIRSVWGFFLFSFKKKDGKIVKWWKHKLSRANKQGKVNYCPWTRSLIISIFYVHFCKFMSHTKALWVLLHQFFGDLSCFIILRRKSPRSNTFGIKRFNLFFVVINKNYILLINQLIEILVSFVTSS